MEPLTLAALSALAVKIVSALKYLTARDINAFVTQVIAWVVGIGVIALAAQADLAAGIDIGGVLLQDLDFASQVFVGLGLASAASFAFDVKKALDGSDSAKEPSLGGVPPQP